MFRVRVDTPIDTEADKLEANINAAVAAMFAKYPTAPRRNADGSGPNHQEMTMNKQASWFSTLCAILAIAGTALRADRVRLRSGQVVNGDFMSADVKIVRVLLQNGSVAQFPVEDVSALEFTPRKAPPAPAPDPSKAPASVTLPAMTILNVLLTQAIDVDAARPAMTFKSLLDDPVMMDGKRRCSAERGGCASGGEGSSRQAPCKGADKITLQSELVFVWRSKIRHRDRVRRTARRRRRQENQPARSLAGPAWAPSSGESPAAARARPSARRSAGQPAPWWPARARSTSKLPAETRLQFQLTAAVTVQP